MKRLLAAALLLVGCRPADGGSQNAPGSASKTAQTSRNSDSATTNALLERADAGRIQGSRTAPVWLIEISDFQCPFCKRWHDETYPTIVREFVQPGIVRMAYINLPLAQHQHAQAAAEAALCAATQDKFWPLHDKLFATQDRWAPLTEASAVFDSLAGASGVNITEWRSCVRSRVMQRVVNGDKYRAASSGARSTPTFFVGDQPIEGAQPIDTFRLAIQRARAKAGSRSP